VRKILVLGEPISKNKWRRMKEAWGEADLYAHYGLTEVDTGLHTCPLGHYHTPASPFAHFNLVDDKVRPIEGDGIQGEIVISVLKKAHAPLINYRTGDLAVRLAGRCRCGSVQPRYHLVGRRSDGLRVGDRLVFPIDLEDQVYALEDVGNEYVFVIEQDGALLLLLERAFGSSSPLERIAATVQNAVASALAVPARVTVTEFGGIADKLGIAKKKGGRFTDLRGLDASARENELRINVIDAHQLRSGSGVPISI
jgi:phenylacetate-coenzyme A ligase PaaK-like adenylate-forming protein